MTRKSVGLSKTAYYTMASIGLLVGVYNSLKGYGPLGYYTIFVPIIYFFLMIASVNNMHSFGALGSTVINIIMFIRYVVIPYQVDPSYASLFSVFDISSTLNISYTILTIEMIVSFIALSLFTKKSVKRSDLSNSPGVIDIFSTICIIIFIFSLLYYPSLYSNFFNFGYGEVSGYSGVPGEIAVFSQIGFDIIYVVSVVLISGVGKQDKKSHLLMLSIIITIMYLSTKWARTGSNVSRWSLLIYSLVSVYFLSRLYPRHSKQLLSISIPVIGVMVIIMTILKFNTSLTEVITQLTSPYILDLYFNGLYGINYGILTSQFFSSSITLSTLLTDMFSAVPYISRFFDATINSTPYYFHIAMSRTDTIIPTVAQGYIYFGIFGSSIITLLFIVIVVQLDRVIFRTTNPLLLFPLVLLTLWLSLPMALNLNIIQEGLWKKIIFVVIITLESKFHLFPLKLKSRG